MKDTKPLWKKESNSLLLGRLTRIQSEEGYCSEERLNDLALELNVPPSRLFEVATFYSFLRVTPGVETSIHVCTSPSCFINGVEEVYRAFSNALNIEAGEQTKDKKFSLDRTSCIGCCDECPSALVNGRPVTRLTPDKAKELVGTHAANLKENGR